MGKTPSNAGRSRGILFVLVLAALILGMGWYFAAGVLRERSRATPEDSAASQPGSLPR
jgi:hypothetical protein